MSVAFELERLAQRALSRSTWPGSMNGWAAIPGLRVTEAIPHRAWPGGAGRRSPSVCPERQTWSAGGSPAGARARRPVAWMAGRRETEALKPIDKAIKRMVSESPGRNESERTGSLENDDIRRPSACWAREGGRVHRSLASAVGFLRRGGSDGTVTRARRATGETLLVPPRNRRKRVGPITSAPGKWADGERVADGPEVAMRRGNARGAKGSCCSAMPPTTRKAGAS